MYKLAIRRQWLILAVAITGCLAFIILLPGREPDKAIKLSLVLLLVGEIIAAGALALLCYPKGAPLQLIRIAASFEAAAMILGAAANLTSPVIQLLPGPDLVLSWVQLFLMNLGGLLAMSIYKLNADPANADVFARTAVLRTSKARATGAFPSVDPTVQPGEATEHAPFVQDLAVSSTGLPAFIPENVNPGANFSQNANTAALTTAPSSGQVLDSGGRALPSSHRPPSSSYSRLQAQGKKAPTFSKLQALSSTTKQLTSDVRSGDSQGLKSVLDRLDEQDNWMRSDSSTLKPSPVNNQAKTANSSFATKNDTSSAIAAKPVSKGFSQVTAKAVSDNSNTPENKGLSENAGKAVNTGGGKAVMPASAGIQGIAQKSTPTNTGVNQAATQKALPGNTGTNQAVTQKALPGNTGTSQAVAQKVLPGNTSTNQAIAQKVNPVNTVTNPATGQRVNPANTITNQALGQSVTPVNTGSNQALGQRVTPVNTGSNQALGQRVTPVNTGSNRTVEQKVSPVSSGANQAIGQRVNPINASTSQALGQRVTPVSSGANQAIGQRVTPVNTSTNQAVGQRVTPANAGSNQPALQNEAVPNPTSNRTIGANPVPLEKRAKGFAPGGAKPTELQPEMDAEATPLFEGGVDVTIEQAFANLVSPESQREVQSVPKGNLFDDGVNSEIDQLFSNLVAAEAQKELVSVPEQLVSAQEELKNVVDEAPIEDGTVHALANVEEVSVKPEGLFGENVNTEIDQIFASLVPAAAQQEVLNRADNSVQGEENQAQREKEEPVKHDGLFGENVNAEIDQIFEGLAPPEAQRGLSTGRVSLEQSIQPAFLLPDQKAQAVAKQEESFTPLNPPSQNREVREFGRLSAKSAMAESEGESTGSMKTIGKLLIDVQMVENIIKSGEGGKIGANFSNARIISEERGQGIKFLLETIHECKEISGCLIVGHDGLVIASTLEAEIDKEVLGALSTALLSTTNLATLKLDIGKLSQMILFTSYNNVSFATILTDVEVGILVVLLEFSSFERLDEILQEINSTVQD